LALGLPLLQHFCALRVRVQGHSEKPAGAAKYTSRVLPQCCAAAFASSLQTTPRGQQRAATGRRAGYGFSPVNRHSRGLVAWMLVRRACARVSVLPLCLCALYMQFHFSSSSLFGRL
jgi:hypothetical protein